MRNIDIPSPDYEEARDNAAREYAAEQNQDGNAEALALRQAFTVGADTASQFRGAMVLMHALKAGRRWALSSPEKPDLSDLPTTPGSVIQLDSLLMRTRFGNWVSDGGFIVTDDDLAADMARGPAYTPTVIFVAESDA